MKTRMHYPRVLAWISTFCFQLSAFAQGTAFTYQGRLTEGANPANGIYDLQFAIYDSSDGLTMFAGPLTNSPTSVSNGLFTVALDFGGGVFTGLDRWLEIAVRTNGGGTFDRLMPRQQFLPTPYAIYTANAGLAASAASATTVAANGVDSASLQNNAVTGAKILNGTISAADLDSTSFSTTFWKINGNAGTSPGTHFIGTTDDQSLVFKVNSSTVLRLQSHPSGASFVGGNSTIDPNTYRAVVVGGSANTIESAANNAFIGGGTQNEIQTSAIRSMIGGGFLNRVGTNAQDAVIGGGYENRIGTNAFSSVILGGTGNIIEDAANYSAIGGGIFNVIGTDSVRSAIAGGQGNVALPQGFAGAIGGGYLNTNGGGYSTVPGGSQNAALGSYSFAAGRKAKAINQGSFVWADSQNADFSSTSNNQFLIRASGGMGINTNNPQSALHVNGIVTANGFAGNGDGLSALNASQLATGTVPDARLSSNVALRDAIQTFTGSNSFLGPVGIGTNMPATALTVATGVGYGIEHTDGTRRLNTYLDASGCWLGSVSPDDLNFYVNNGVSSMTIDVSSQVGIGTTAPTNKLHVVGGATFTSGFGGANQTVVWTPGSGSWSFTSDRETKENISPVNSRQILEKVAQLPLAEWNYAGYPQRHIGPMAQEFHALFPLNDNDKALNDADLHGVALAAIQGLNKKLMEREVQVQKLQEQVQRLEQLFHEVIQGKK